ncbi:hypothetical protein CSB45_11330 [candidate division KSB3 bacterium]|uniref:SHOCT domain-containing protein n=1 Tax=candidate division KSB3 bacterium TaxID=2044937 RepID=A0A2G6E3T4_9BACT|nr:MAG: hypothetical protein CSB45_11330 [candidate division KSB3 bacterium]PIE28905.1 MAG: hypothetical protein CSA57_11380 [candidate division KSB3 bacterium]
MNYYDEYKDLIQRLASGDFSQSSQKERDATVSKIIHASAVTSTLVSVIPLPMIETPIQMTMVRSIGKVYEQELDEKVVLEIMSVIGGNVLLRQLMRLIPYVGFVINLSRVYGTTWAIGSAAEYYFKHDREVEKEELMQVFKTVLKQKTQEKEHDITERRVEERLEELKSLLEKGLITQEEFDKKREAVIAEL